MATAKIKIVVAIPTNGNDGRAKSVIAAHACDGLRARDVAEQLGVSRSLLDLRFRQVCGRSVLECILTARLEEVKRLLTETGNTILQIGRNCGFNDPDNLKRLFRRRFGLTMRQFRNQATLSLVRGK